MKLGLCLLLMAFCLAGCHATQQEANIKRIEVSVLDGVREEDRADDQAQWVLTAITFDDEELASFTPFLTSGNAWRFNVPADLAGQSKVMFHLTKPGSIPLSFNIVEGTAAVMIDAAMPDQKQPLTGEKNPKKLDYGYMVWTIVP